MLKLKALRVEEQKCRYGFHYEKYDSVCLRYITIE